MSSESPQYALNYVFSNNVSLFEKTMKARTKTNETGAGLSALDRTLEEIKPGLSDRGYSKAKEILTEIYKEVADKKPETKKQMIRQAKRIMELIGLRNEYGEDAWNDLKAEMNERGWKKNYQRYNFYCLKLMARATKSNWPWYLKPPKKPQKREVIHPVMPSDTLQRAIQRKKMYEPRERFCLALSSTYGLRQIEIRNVRREHIDKDKHQITIHTAKGESKRIHVVPEPIRGVLYNFNPAAHIPRSRTGLSRIFHSIFDPISKRIRNSRGYDAEDPDPWGFHSIRRRLNTDLGSMRGENGKPVFTEDEVVDFMRWEKPKKTMFHPYFHGTEELKKEDKLALDRRIFAKHPYLKYWAS